MNIPNKFITYGYTLKNNIFTVLSDIIIKNTFVLEERSPYPGYHGENLPLENNVPGHFFFVTKTKVSFEQLHRIQLNIRKKIKIDFILDMGEFFFRNSSFPFLRLKGIREYSSIAFFQNLIDKEGVLLAKPFKIEENVVVRIDKYFELEKLGDYVFKDNENENIFYLDILHNLDWEKFVEISKIVRNNLMAFPNFDVALSVIYFKTGLLDAVRIYCDKLNQEMLLKLRNKYLEIIEREIF